jgi:hypothetical protein
MEVAGIIQIQKSRLWRRQIIDALSYPKSSCASSRRKTAMLRNSGERVHGSSAFMAFF